LLLSFVDVYRAIGFRRSVDRETSVGIAFVVSTRRADVRKTRRGDRVPRTQVFGRLDISGQVVVHLFVGHETVLPHFRSKNYIRIMYCIIHVVSTHA